MSNNCNFYKHSNHCYSVKNQNGFNNALYHYFGATDNGEFGSLSKKEVRQMVQNYPKEYPSTIIVVDQSFEFNSLHIEQIKFTEKTYINYFGEYHKTNNDFK